MRRGAVSRHPPWKERCRSGAAPALRFRIPFPLARRLGVLSEAVTTPLGMRLPQTRLAVGVMGMANGVGCHRARRELGWEGRVFRNEALRRIQPWVAANCS